MGGPVLVGADPVGLVDVQPKVGERAAAIVAEQTTGLFVDDREPSEPVWRPDVHNNRGYRKTDDGLTQLRCVAARWAAGLRGPARSASSGCVQGTLPSCFTGPLIRCSASSPKPSVTCE